jgi:hypothetical protein
MATLLIPVVRRLDFDGVEVVWSTVSLSFFSSRCHPDSMRRIE